MKSHLSFLLCCRWGSCTFLLYWLYWVRGQEKRGLVCWLPSPSWTVMLLKAVTSHCSTTSTTLEPGIGQHHPSLPSLCQIIPDTTLVLNGFISFKSNDLKWLLQHCMDYGGNTSILVPVIVCEEKETENVNWNPASGALMEAPHYGKTTLCVKLCQYKAFNVSLCWK